MNNNAKHILVVDDEPDIIEILRYNFVNEGYRVSSASNGEEAIKQCENNQFDLVVLDVMMPKKDGIEACREIREIVGYEHTIIIFLTARGEEYSEIAGFDAGADDYITKPIKPRAFLTRVKSLLKRNERSSSDTSINIGDLNVNPDSYIIEKGGQKFQLPKKEFKLVELLASSPGKVFTRDQVLSRIWGRDLIVGDRTVDVHIRKIRKKLGNNLIRTIKGVGYKLEI